MMDSNHEVPLDGFGIHGTSDYIVQPTFSTAPNQVLQLVTEGSNINSVGVSGIDGLHSFGYSDVDGVNPVGISPGIDSRAGRTSSSNPKSSKKKNSYYHRRSGEKKERLVWTPELHQCFLEYYNRFPNEKRVPKKILEEMRQRFPYITRENVASHLQKHRLNLKNSKKNKEMGNSAKSSSKSVPRKVIKEESNFHQFYNNSSISTCPNAAQFPHQSHSISANPNSQLPLQSHSISTNPNSQLPLQSHSISTSPNPQLPLQSHSISTNPNSQLPLQSHSISTSPNTQLPLQSLSISTSPNSQLPLQSHTLHETLLNQVLFQFDETHLSDQNMVHVQSLLNIGRNDVPIHGGGANIYSNYTMNVLESERSPLGVIWQSSNAASDFPVRVNLFPPPIPNNHDQLILNIDGNGNGFHPMIMDNSFGDLSDNDYSFGALPYFLDYNMNFCLDNVQVDGVNNMYSLGSYSDALQFVYPLNFNVENELLQLQDFEQALESIFYPTDNHLVDDASKFW